MIDLLPYAAEKIAETGAQVELAYNGIEAVFPLVVLTEVGNETELTDGTKEAFSTISIQTDCYHHTEQEARELALLVSEKMTESGFRRVSGGTMQESDISRYSMRFITTADEQNSRLYRG